MSLLYRRYLRLLEKWPVDETKRGRDLGDFIRKQVKVKFTLGELSKQVDESECEKTCIALERLANDHYRKRYARIDFSATGLTAEQCKGVLSDDFLQLLTENEKGIVRRLF